MLSFANKAMAEEAIDHLSEGDDGVGQAAALSMKPGEANRVMMYAPGILQPNNPQLNAKLKGLQPGKCSEPFVISKTKGAEIYGVIELVELLPAESPSIDNSNVVAGLLLMNDRDQAKAKKYNERLAEVENAALSKIDYRFVTDEYSQARQLFKDMALHNPQIPTVSPTGSVPQGGSAPVVPGGK
jgi:hypothetical protein